MVTHETYLPVLVISSDPIVAAQIVNDLRSLRRVAVAVDECATALEMMRTIAFALIIVEVAVDTDWRTCERIAVAARCPVAVVTSFLAPDGRYRSRAFRWGIAAYISKPCTRPRLKQALRRIESGERTIEIVDSSGRNG